MGRYRSSSAGLAASLLGLLCAVALSACLNPIPDDFPNGNDRHVDEAPAPGATPDNAGGGGGTVAPPSQGSGGEDDGEQTPIDSEPVPPAAGPIGGPDAGVGDAGAAGGSIGGR